MRKEIIIQVLLAGICLCISAYAFTGCSRDRELVSFSETLPQESASLALIEDEKKGDSYGSGLAANGSSLDSGTDLAKEPHEKQIVVYLCGAVKNPGVFTLPEGSRVNDAVEAAGGLTETAAEASVNLAAKLNDEEMIYVFTREEAEKAAASGSHTVAGTTLTGMWTGETEPSGTEAAGQLININTADINNLCRLPGIGESKARDIVTYREKNGDFQKKEDIMKVTGIKENLYQRISALISVK